MSQGELSRLSGVSLSTVNRIATNSTTRVDLDTLDKLSLVLECPPGDLLRRRRKA
jgi:DNA-binding Xre family transcriptional regulator